VVRLSLDLHKGLSDDAGQCSLLAIARSKSSMWERSERGDTAGQAVLSHPERL
jgi:hypothetical protein